MRIFYKNEKAKTIRRTETNTLADFLATCGGLLGLFLGISALGFIEIIYFLTLRLFWNIRKSLSEITVEVFNQNVQQENGLETTSNEVSYIYSLQWRHFCHCLYIAVKIDG